MLNPIVHQTADGKQHTGRQLTIGEMATLCEEVWQKERIRLLEDLDASNATDEFRLEAISELRERRGLASFMLMQVFRLEYAQLVLQIGFENYEQMGLMADEAVGLAGRCLGYEPDEKDEGATQAADPTEASRQPS